MQTNVEHPEKRLTKKFSKLAWILALKVAWIWRGFFGAGKQGLKNSGRFRDNIRDKIRDKTRDKIRASFR